MCLWEHEQDWLNEDKSKIKTVIGMKGYASDGIPWQMFFDGKKKTPVVGFSGDGEDGGTLIRFDVEKYQPSLSKSKNQYEYYLEACIADYGFDVIPEGLVPSAEFGLFVL